ncbi:hypothetical protein R1flu_000645 [Riccia fluitans]|uniref:Uncharacterized protein n=1 Tax=Riccia fluitans TaxID=41844 RepID=A0ABD1Y120_9MARC
MSCRTGIGSGFLDTKVLAEGLLVWILQQEPDLDNLLTRTMAKCCSRFENRGEECVASGRNRAPESRAGNCPTRKILLSATRALEGNERNSLKIASSH